MIDRIISALVALSLAFLVWLYARSRDQEILDNVPVPVAITLAPNQSDQYSLEVNGPCQVPVSFSGPPARIRDLRGMLQRGEVQVEITLTVPEDRQTEGRYLDTVRVEAGDVHPPAGVTPLVVEGRNRIPVTVHRLVERRLPVRFDAAPEDRIAQVSVQPATVLVRGPEEVLDRTRAVPLQPCALPPRSDEATAARTVAVGPVPLVQELEGRPVHITPASVMVHLTLQPRRKTYEVEVPVNFLCPANFALRPGFNGDGRDGKVTLTVEGPAADEPPAVFAFIDLTRRKFEQGLHHEPLRLQLPKEYQVVQPPARLVPFRLDPPELLGKGVGG
jgi:hypothetical protein